MEYGNYKDMIHNKLNMIESRCIDYEYDNQIYKMVIEISDSEQLLDFVPTG
jgi:hypothetical protein